ncbi:MAG: hypothetical protein Q4F80_07875, partial [bacterium]|nr:hypothetical protein [bacterium]
TTDGMRYEFNMTSSGEVNGHLKLHESDIMVCEALHPNTLGSEYSCGGCGSYGMIHNPNNTTKPPCLIIVDVNGDKKPTPANIYCGKNEDGSGRHDGCAKEDNRYKVPLPGEKKVRDIFSILITEDRAIPYGVTAQKAMYNSQK